MKYTITQNAFNLDIIRKTFYEKVNTNIIENLPPYLGEPKVIIFLQFNVR